MGAGRAILEPVYHLMRPSQAELAALAEQQSTKPVSYDDVGPLLSGPRNREGFHRLAVRREIGSGRETFDAARSAIIDWAGHRRAGAIIEPERPELAVGQVMALALRVWPLWMTASCRVVEIVDESDRFGFTYGTLPHHPASGEERFEVIRNPETDLVRLEVTALSRPASGLVRLAGPIGRVMQRLTANRYIDGFQKYRPMDHVAQSVRTSSDLGGPLSWRWWFESRVTGEITIAQSPNWPLFAIAATWAVRLIAGAGSGVADAAGWLGTALWIYWGADEVLRGVNPWRKVLGGVLVATQVVRIFG